MTTLDADHGSHIAVIGMAARFPGAANVDEFWRNLCDGVDSIERAPDAGRAAPLAGDPRHVHAYASAPNVDRFDASFFGYSAADAVLIDPQQRLFLECAWEALEAAGHAADSFDGRIGVFGACSVNMYLLRNILGQRDLRSFNQFQVLFGNDKDFLASRVSYKLNLTGPSVTVQTACSSSLVAAQLACQSLNVFQCDMALAGGVALHDLFREGYLHEPDGILSPDGHCRAFDAAGGGTVMSSGAGVVVLRRLKDALEQRDQIHAIIRGCAVNNDGARKVGYAAPSVDGQSEVIVEAHALAGVSPETIGYVEAHGTGTQLGDPIEVAGLSQAFRAATAKRNFCALGSLKANVGHLDSAAGVAGLIKTILVVRDGKLPPTPNFRTPNPEIDWLRSPFYVNTVLQDWPARGEVRRAAVSSFGIGGTNAHMVIEEWPPPEERPCDDRRPRLLVLSAQSERALAEAVRNLRIHLEARPGLCLDDVAYTLQVGRKHFRYRRAITCRTVPEAIAALKSTAAMQSEPVPEVPGGVAFFFPERAACDPSMLAQRAADPAFWQELEAVAQALSRRLARPVPVDDMLSVTTTAAFAVGYSLARCLVRLGVLPNLVIGVGVGELAAACLAGAVPLDRALDILCGELGSSNRSEASAVSSAIPILSRRTGDASRQWGDAGLAECTEAPLWPPRAASTLAQAARALVVLGDPSSDAVAPLAGVVSLHYCLDAPESKDAAGRTWLGVLGELWVRGATVDWQALHADEALRRVPLPTYPFQRERHWLTPAVTSELDAGARPEPSPSAPLFVETAAEGPRADLAQVLREIVAESIQVDPAQVDMSKDFYALGLDSISLMQVSARIKARLQGEVTFRQIADEFSSPEALLIHLSRTLPAGRLSAPTEARERPAAASDPAVSGHAADQSVATQLAELARQLESLRRAIASQPPAGVGAPAATTPARATRPRPAQAAPLVRAEGLTGEQILHVRQVSEQLLRRTRTSRQLASETRARHADVRNSHRFRMSWKQVVYPLVISRAQGAKVWDADGNEYIDLAMGYGANLFGHAPAFLTQALREVLDSNGLVLGANSPLAGKTAALLARLTGMERATFCNTGSEAVMTAIRLARAHTRRASIALFEGSYHGNFDEVLVKKAGAFSAAPSTLGAPPTLIRDCRVLKYGDAEALQWLRAHGHELAAVLVEPIQSRNLTLQAREFLHALRQITREAGTVLIFDEVVTGFRVHLGGAQAWFGVRADLATYGKVVGAGMPIGFVAGSAPILDGIDGGAWEFDDESFPCADQIFSAGTFTKHPLSVAAAWAVMNRLEEDGGQLQKTLNRRTAELAQELDDIFNHKGVGIEVAHAASIFSLRPMAGSPYADFLIHELTARGIYVGGGHASFLSTAHTEEDLDRIVAAVAASVDAMGAVALLPSRRRTLPLSSLQREVWLADRALGAASAAFHLGLAVELRGPLRLPAFAQALDQVVRRHDALRMCVDEGGAVQTLLDVARGPCFTTGGAGRYGLANIGLIDLCALEPSLAQRTVRDIIAEQERKPFDLADGPPFRANLLRQGPEHHIFLFVVHHVAFDAWSHDILRQELASSFASFCEGVSCALPAASSYADYVSEQSAAASAVDDEAARAFWRRLLERPGTLPKLPADLPRAPFGAFSGGRHRVVIPAELAAHARRLAGASGLSLYSLLLAAFQAFLHGLIGNDEFAVGIVVLCASAMERQPMIGLRSQVLPVWAEIRPSSSLLELAAEAKQGILEARDNAERTLGDFVRKGTLSRNPTRLPPFPVTFNLDKAPPTGDGVPGVDAVLLTSGRPNVLHELTFNVVDTGSSLLLECDYSADLFLPETIVGWVDDYLALLAQLVDHPRDAVREHSGHRPASFVHREFASRALRDPDRVAVRCGADQWTYRHLAARAARVAATLRARGVKPEVRVAAWMDRSPDLIACLLGILAAGGAYVPLDPDYPTLRLESMLRDSGAQVLVTDREGDLAGWFAQGKGLRLAELEDDGRSLEFSPDPLSPDNLAYVIFTSGSTGKPKGIQISHASLANLMSSARLQLGFGSGERVACVSSFSFDMAVFEIFLPLVAGSELLIVPRATAYAGVDFARLLEETQTTLLYATPSLLRQLVKVQSPLPALTILSGGEALPSELAADLRGITPSLWNMYGPTEVTVWCSGGRVERGAAISLGTAVRKSFMTLQGSRWEELGPGEQGEVMVGGEALARGYLDNPGLTASLFVPSARGEFGGRVYKTGDEARMLADGLLEFRGRLDRQVKIHGVRVELEEVRGAIAAEPGIRQCAVLAKTAPSGEVVLVAYVATNGAVSSWELRKTLRASMPEAMIPARIIEVEAFPLTANGKTDFRALPDPFVVEAVERTSGIEPLDAGYEQEVARLWGHELAAGVIGPHDNFFDFGGNSFQAVRLMGLMKSELGLVVSFQDFLFKTLRQMVAGASKAR